MASKNFRKRGASYHHQGGEEEVEEEEESRLASLEEVKLLQRERERRTRMPGCCCGGSNTTTTMAVVGGDDSKEELVLQDTFAQETSEANDDSLMSQYVEQELAKRRRRGEKNHQHHPIHKDKEEEEDHRLHIPIDNHLYITPPHLNLNKRYSANTHTQWTTGIAEVQLPIEYKLKNIEETEAAKKLLQEKRLTGRTKSELNIPSSYSADYFHRGLDYAEKLRREHPELYKDRGTLGDALGCKPASATGTDITERRQAASDEFMLERFRKREKFRVMRR